MALSLKHEFNAFVIEQFPFAHDTVLSVWPKSDLDVKTEKSCLALGEDIKKSLAKKFKISADPNIETTPFVSAKQRLELAHRQLLDSVDGFFVRQSIKLSMTKIEKKWMLQGIILTRAVDNCLKRVFMSGEIKYQEKGFQGKGFRSLGQEAIYAAALRLRRGPKFFVDEQWRGDVVAPVIRDLGIVLAFTDNDIESVINAQMGKEGAPLDGKDLHLGNLNMGVVPPAAPLSIATCTVTGMAYAMKLRNEDRVGVSFIGEGGSSLGEWHEAVNLAASRRLPVIFCIENNQRALSTPVEEQSAVRVFGDKAAGYGMPHVTIDGTKPDDVAAAFAWSADRARVGKGPVLIELVCMRMCGHAHHDDMLYLGREPDLTFELPEPKSSTGYMNVDEYRRWARRDPLSCYSQQLVNEGICTQKEIEEYKEDALVKCKKALSDVKGRQWPPSKNAGVGVYSDGTFETHLSLVELEKSANRVVVDVEIESAPEWSPKGATFLEAICVGVKDVLSSRADTLVLGEDVAPPYGNAFMVFKPILEELGHRFYNTPIAEGAIIGACVGMALEGLRPIGEMQFNDFVASGFNELVNNAAKFHYRTGRKVPMVLRMPWGGLRRAGPFHSQDTIPWFYRTFGLKIVVPSTPYDARALLNAAVLDDNPVLFYEHIALYRDPSIRQMLPEEPGQISIGKAAFRQLGEDMSIISYGAFVHRAIQCAKKIREEDGVSCDVLDLRSLVPLDFEAISATVKRTGRVLLVGEDSRKGSVLESIASQISEGLYRSLDAPVRVLGALDTPVPYSPSLEDEFLVSNDYILRSARELLAW